ncbi:nuclear transport factor 2 family protein [Mycetocola lacteus]|uniref:Nuclear transport factor 2 family protein n=1 Tax=Mycetocola lacteus TaxID=76637 RepID=A0A3L7ASR0_9MICO|nr:nuclear transport factor 2 family protein [Mycetocola lacteus]RLP83035.1 nuclear transport factor 2 family protein [Mycetocola lacteus]
MTSPHHSPIIDRFFDLMEGDKKWLVAEVFSPDAVVTDDGQSHHGTAAIIDWLGGDASEYEVTSTWISSRELGAATAVTQLLEGNFPGGRVQLVYTFEVGAAGLIDALSIVAE